MTNKQQTPAKTINNRALIQAVRRCLCDAIAPQVVEIHDHSHRHIHHRQYTGGAHLHITIIAADFAGISTLAQHRLINNLLKSWLDNGEIHALQLHTAAYHPCTEEVAS